MCMSPVLLLYCEHVCVSVCPFVIVFLSVASFCSRLYREYLSRHARVRIPSPGARFGQGAFLASALVPAVAFLPIKTIKQKVVLTCWTHSEIAHDRTGTCHPYIMCVQDPRRGPAVSMIRAEA